MLLKVSLTIAFEVILPAIAILPVVLARRGAAREFAEKLRQEIDPYQELNAHPLIQTIQAHIERTGLLEAIGEDHIYPTLEAAVRFIEKSSVVPPQFIVEYIRSPIPA